MSNVELKKDTVELADKIKEGIKIDPKTGVGTITPDIYEKLLPEGISIKQIEAINAHNTHFAASATLAFGEASIPVLKKNKELPKTNLEIPLVGKDHIGLVFNRSQQVRAPGSSEETTVYGTVRPQFNFYGTKSRGEMAKVKSILNEKAGKALGD